MELLHKKSLTHSHFISLSHLCIYFTTHQTFYITNTLVCKPFETFSGIVATDLPRTLRYHFHFNKIAFPVHNSSVIFAERSSDDVMVLLRIDMRELALFFVLGEHKNSCMILRNLLYNDITDKHKKWSKLWG